MADKNILGAPAHGFGQEVSYAADLGNVPLVDAQSVGVTQPGGVAGGRIAGGAQREGPRLQDKPSSTAAVWDFVQKLGSEVLQKKIQEKRQEAFVKGMMSAAQGQGLKDILEGDNQYFAYFQDSDVVSGARAYTVAAKAQQLAGSLEQMMPELRKLDPADAQAHAIELMKGNLTGDAATDQQIQMEFAKTLPHVMRKQAKENWQFRQEDMLVRQSGARLATAAAVEGRLRDMADNPANSHSIEAGAVASTELLQMMQPAAGQDRDSFVAGTIKDITNIAMDGNIHAAKTMMAALEPGLKPDERLVMQRQYEAAEAKARAKVFEEISVPYTDLMIRAAHFTEDLDPNEILQQVNDLNDKASRHYGFTKPVLTPSQVAHPYQTAFNVLLNEGERRAKLMATEASKAASTANSVIAKQAAEALRQENMGKSAADSLAGAKRSKIGTVDEVETSHLNAFSQLDTPEKQLAFLSRSWIQSPADGVNSKLATQFSDRVMRLVGQDPARYAKDASPLMAIKDEFARYQALKSVSPGLAEAYYPKGAADRLELIEAIAGTDPTSPRFIEAAIQSLTPADMPKRQTLDKAERKQVDAYIGNLARGTAADASRIRRWMFGEALAPNADTRAMTGVLESRIASMRLLNPDLEVATTRAYQQMVSEGRLEMIAGYPVAGQPGSTGFMARLYEHRPNDPDFGAGEKGIDGKEWNGATQLYNTVLRNTIDSRFGLLDKGKPDHVSVVRTMEVGNEPALLVYGDWADGTEHRFVIFARDIKQDAKALVDFQQKGKADTKAGQTRIPLARPAQ